jgi:ABC-type bacteriocin/lantibiotic exporter with double-glycine peptidase domain
MIKSLFKLLEVVVSEFKVLYFIAFISIVSLFVELLAMMLLSGISQNEFKLFDSYFKSLGMNIVFIFIIFIFCIRFILLLYTEIKKIHIAKKIQTFLTLYMYKLFLNSTVSAIEKESIGKFMLATGDESSRASEIVKNSFSIIITMCSIVLYTIMIIYIDFNMIYLLTIFLLLIIFIFKILMEKSKINSEKLIPSGSYVNSLLIDTMNGIRVIKSFGILEFTFNKYKVGLEDYQNLNFKTEYYATLNKFISLILITIFFNMYLLYNYFTNQIIDVLYFVTIFFILIRLLSFFGDLLHQINKIYIDLNASSNLLGHLHSKIKKKTKPNLILDIIKDIELRNVTFNYNEIEKSVFKNLSMNFKKDKSYAIIGESGSGKSTLTDILMDFLTPSYGSVLINGIDSKIIDEKHLSSKIIYVGQESIIFNDSIKNNICIGSEYSEEMIINSLEQVELKNEILEKKEKLEFILNYKGTNISGGQKQRLNIARAILRNPDVLILDESVNALDKSTRLSIVKNLLDRYKEKMIIFITHDEDILSLVDNIIDLDIIKKDI